MRPEPTVNRLALLRVCEEEGVKHQGKQELKEAHRVLCFVNRKEQNSRRRF